VERRFRIQSNASTTDTQTRSAVRRAHPDQVHGAGRTFQNFFCSLERVAG